ncbi:MAG TPA: toxic anion resistance protein [Candidatus Aphodomonas merdavium]|nr:toxic anion resistance protein [Candidatus Aphodomonas merdavium]
MQEATESAKLETTANVKAPEDITLSQLSSKDQEAVRQYAGQIDVTNASEVLQYGAAAQQKLTVFADAALANARTKDTGEMGDTLADLVTQLQGFQPGEEKKGLFSFFRRGASQIANLKARYDKVTVSVDEVANRLEDYRIGLLKDIAMLERLYDENVEYYRQLCFYILAGKEKIETLRSGELQQARKKAEETGDPADAQAANDLAAAIDRFEKKIFDLELTRQISIQMAPQIRLLENNNALLADKIHSALVNTLPLWKSQMVLALGLENSRNAQRASQAVNDATNQMLLKNAQQLKEGTVATAREVERGIVDIETLTATNKALIDTLTEVESIQGEGRRKRAEAETKLREMEDELKTKLLAMRDGSTPPPPAV